MADEHCATQTEVITGEDRRKALRTRIELPVTIKFNSHGQYEFAPVSRDYSASGIYLYLDTAVQVGEKTTVAVTIPSEFGEPVSMNISGTVVRVDRTEQPGVAIAFDSLIIEPRNH